MMMKTTFLNVKTVEDVEGGDLVVTATRTKTAVWVRKASSRSRRILGITEHSAKKREKVRLMVSGAWTTHEPLKSH